MLIVGSLRTACSIKDYCSPVLCLGAKQRTPSPSLVAFYTTPGKVWAVCMFFVPVPAEQINVLFAVAGLLYTAGNYGSGSVFFLGLLFFPSSLFSFYFCGQKLIQCPLQLLSL